MTVTLDIDALTAQELCDLLWRLAKPPCAPARRERLLALRERLLVDALGLPPAEERRAARRARRGP
jgi:hypothetical protein